MKPLSIEKYSFGSITIGGDTYTRDVIIYPEHVEPSWWRRDGHSVSVDDLAQIVDFKPGLLILGTGAYGVMKVPEETLSFLHGHGIEVVVDKTAAAVERFNAHAGAGTVAALHLTC